MKSVLKNMNSLVTLLFNASSLKENQGYYSYYSSSNYYQTLSLLRVIGDIIEEIVTAAAKPKLVKL